MSVVNDVEKIKSAMLGLYWGSRFCVCTRVHGVRT